MKFKSTYQKCFAKTNFEDQLLTIINNTSIYDIDHMRTGLQNLHASEVLVLEFNSKREKAKLTNILEKMTANLAKTKKETFEKEEGKQLIEAQRRHEELMADLRQRSLEVKNDYVDLMNSIAQEMKKTRVMNQEHRQMLCEAFEKDRIENGYFEEIEKILADIDRFDKFRKTLEKLKLNIYVDSFNINRYAYIMHVIGNTHLLLTSMLPSNLPETAETDCHVAKQLMELLKVKTDSEDGILEAISGLRAFEYSDNQFPLVAFSEELGALISKLKSFVENGRMIPKAVPSQHLQKLLFKMNDNNLSFQVLVFISIAFLSVVVFFGFIF